MTEDTRYDVYFAQSLEQCAAADPSARAAYARALLAQLETSIAKADYDVKLQASEIRLARAAAAKAIAALNRDARGGLRKEGLEFALDLFRRLRRSPRGVILVIVAVLIYAIPLVYFAREERLGAKPVPAQNKDIAFKLSVSVADFSKETLTFQVEPVAGALIQNEGLLSDDLTVKIDVGNQVVSHIFESKKHILPWTFEVYLESGDILNYPFDQYYIEIYLDAFVKDKALSTITGLGHVPHGIRTALSDIRGQDGFRDIAVTMRRSGTVIFLALLSTFSLLVVAVAALSVAWQVAHHNRNVDFSMMTWVAAFMFVVPGVRNALPGAPPEGALIDYMFFYWLQVLAAIATSVLVYMWIQDRSTAK